MTSADGIHEQAVLREREAHRFRSEHKVEEAFNAYDEAASLYREAGQHLKASFCFAAAATCWNIRTGWQPLRNAASRNELAAREAVRAGHFDYARSLYFEAALLYEKEGDYGRYSDCYYASKRADAKHFWQLFAHGTAGRETSSFPAVLQSQRKGGGTAGRETSSFPAVLQSQRKGGGTAGSEGEFPKNADLSGRFFFFARWALNTVNRLLWGYGERPFRAFAWGSAVIVASALAYTLSGRVAAHGGGVRAISFLEALYMSVITYTTVGYGDFLPVGWTRVFAAAEALSGIFFAPLFLIGLSRRYLRMYR